MSSSNSNHSTESTSLSVHQHDVEVVDTPTTKHSTEVQQHTTSRGIPYVQLDPDYMKDLCWSNDPNDLYLEVYFNPNKLNFAQT